MVAAYQTVYPPMRAFPTVRGRNGIYAVSSFGVEATTFGPDFRVHSITDGPRARELEFRQRYYKCTQHDGKLFDFNGCATRPGLPITQPFIGSSMPTFYVPLSQRRPHDPYRLARLIVNSFTTLVFGHGRWPAIRVVGDNVTQDFAEALVKAQRLPSKMILARNLGGSTGTVGLSWRYWEGKPRVQVHNAGRLHVHEWEDREELIPAHVSQVFKSKVEEYDPKKREYVQVDYWNRRDWTPTAEIGFVPVRATGQPPEWVIDDEGQTFIHNDGFCHFVWIQNVPDDEDSIDGLPDYADVYENFDALDVLNSVLHKGGTLNLDPTLKLRMDPELVKRGGVKKGSDNAIVTGETGDASYMELSGSSISAGNELFKRERSQALEVSQCVVPDPDTVAAAGTSSVAIKAIYALMLNKGDLMRETYGLGVERLLEQQIKSAKRAMSAQVPTPIDPFALEEGYEVDVPEGEETAEEVAMVELPPRIEEYPEEGPDGQPTGNMLTRAVERVPGEGGDVELTWPPYFKPTADDQQKEANTLVAAAGAKPVLSHQSAVERMSASYGLDPNEEWAKVQAQVKQDKAAEEKMFPSPAGEMPTGASPEEIARGEEPTKPPTHVWIGPSAPGGGGDDDGMDST